MAEVSLRKLRKTYGPVVAVEGVDLEIAKGELIVLLGPSGCGKSTTLRMVAGLETISDGELHIGGRNVTALEPKDRDIAMVFQNYALYPHKTIRGNMSFGLKMRGTDTSEITKRVDAAAEMLDITHLLERKPGQLSGGQMQRVALGRALVRDPAVFLLDEPLSNLDAKLRSRMREEIALLQRRIGKAMIYVTHDQTEAMTLADRIVIMRDGWVQQIGSPLEVYDRPANAFVAGFIGSPEMNLVDADLSDGRLVLGEGVSIPAPQGLTRREGRVTVGMRPEAIVPAGEGLPFTIRGIEQLGSQTLFIGELAGRRLRVMTGRRDDVALGSSMRIIVPEAAIHLFDRESGERLSTGR
ncbi:MULTISPECIES: ABC transporter ATP-binding protein [unclassified Shinella]|jgi:ABC-type sugar transport system ATPase subunit|uniref:ABC transporter ATP-binding protein n=1 Tax=unclassified Shinella TaxID=2643062 RepID=UPI0003C570DE|nr:MULTISPECIES: sn-glycerol-3-phosphate ABC transporter ATP-binding protein UgpC [unclassified Shinella]EYR80238.1 sn-glycerol-3-phosphate import ATP-binding protein UgpC [Shinella sp. DD12]MCO5148744.1 sn-glycerol-3-phosphate ABC transporter ATP-binding protein UgpC [Shinella sp.]MDC7264805.1 sn-glycerol-3-phosphate ABC transporter ATP-binding protein UgpC [Shinella sp. HY16]MDC7271702.1 sn-glycerol-3-phosphate ABC transporter ATP-binding protein UgpC [Shinella sp. YZ44]MDG4673481.1 sn-glyce